MVPLQCRSAAVDNKHYQRELQFFCIATEEDACHWDRPLLYILWVERDTVVTYTQSKSYLTHRENHLEELLCGQSIWKSIGCTCVSLCLWVYVCVCILLYVKRCDYGPKCFKKKKQTKEKTACELLICENKHSLLFSLSLEAKNMHVATECETSLRVSASTLQALCGTYRNTHSMHNEEASTHRFIGGTTG